MSQNFIDICIEDSIEELNDHFENLLKSVTFFQKKLLLDCSQSDTNSYSIEFSSLSSEEKQEFRLLNNRGLIQKKGNEVKIFGILSKWFKNYYSDISKVKDQEKGHKIIFSPTFSQGQSQNQTHKSQVNIDINIQIDLPAIQSDFEELKNLMIDKNPKLERKLNEICDSLDELGADDQKKELRKPLNKLGRFLQKIGDKDSDYYPVIKRSKKAIKFAQNTAKTYNKFAQWLALPQVPDLFLKQT